MNLKRIVGSHFANYRESWEANRLIDKGLIHPTLSKVYPLAETGQAALDVHTQQPPGQGRRAGARAGARASASRTRRSGPATSRPSTASAGSDSPPAARQDRPRHARYGERMAGDSAAPLPPAGFEVVRRGYDQEQVEAHLRRLDAETRILSTDRDAAVDQAAQLTRELDDSRARAERLRAQVRTLVSPQQSVQGMSERMRSMLRMAEDEVAEMLQRADAEVAKRLHDAEQLAATLVEDARSEADSIRMQSKADAEAAEEQTRSPPGRAGGRGKRPPRAAHGLPRDGEREIAEARARLAADQRGDRRGHRRGRCGGRAPPVGRVDGLRGAAQAGRGGLPHRDGPTPQGGAHRADRPSSSPRARPPRRCASAPRPRPAARSRPRRRRGGADRGRRGGRRACGCAPSGSAWSSSSLASRADLDALVASLGPLPARTTSCDATPPRGHCRTTGPKTRPPRRRRRRPAYPSSRTPSGTQAERRTRTRRSHSRTRPRRPSPTHARRAVHGGRAPSPPPRPPSRPGRLAGPAAAKRRGLRRPCDGRQPLRRARATREHRFAARRRGPGPTMPRSPALPLPGMPSPRSSPTAVGPASGAPAPPSTACASAAARRPSRAPRRARPPRAAYRPRRPGHTPGSGSRGSPTAPLTCRTCHSPSGPDLDARRRRPSAAAGGRRAAG